jgi:NAD(P) transhydrogenase subunit beta
MSSLFPLLIQGAYLLATVLFILGLHLLRAPTTAPRGNVLAAVGMLVAVIATLLDRAVLHVEIVVPGLLLGALIGTVAARRVRMTAMPEMVGLLNGLGGGASALVAVGEYWRLSDTSTSLAGETTLSILMGVGIGSVTFTGSLIAFGKLQGLVPGRPLTFPLQQPVHTLLLLVMTACGIFILYTPGQMAIFFVLMGLALLCGGLFVLPIGAADMPVVIALLNAFSGLAASATGFVVNNAVLIIAGALVGASGIILTELMCRSMNRSLVQVLFGAFGTGDRVPGATSLPPEKTVHVIDTEEGAMLLAYARFVVIVPGYGLAVAQAQHAVRELADLLKSRGVEVTYAIHPVAGRMPGHMNVLLAEANVPYSELVDMDVINPTFEHTDVALVIGANDIVNPAARCDPQSPLYGMPILDVDKARRILVIKRSLNPGFAGIDNALFYDQRARMLFGDARTAVNGLITAVKGL